MRRTGKKYIRRAREDGMGCMVFFSVVEGGGGGGISPPENVLAPPEL